ncbi:MAG TPA: 3-oxoacyl-[acyl-carrier-protein] synthase III C-terminal domain-containing protein [Kiloniellales bacterium]
MYRKKLECSIMPVTPRLLSLATAVPRHRLGQSDVAAVARRIFDGPDSEIEYLLPIFENAGIAQRHSCVPLEWYLAPVGWKERNRLYLDNALDLIATVATDCLGRAGLGAQQVDAILCVSTTGLATPSLDARLMDRLPFRPDVERLPVFGLGCAGGTLGLARAAALAKAKPGSRVLLLVVELCGLTFRPGDRSRANIVATALFGDGAAAAVLTVDQDGGGSMPGPAVSHWGEYRWPDSLGVMGWEIEADGFGVLFSKDIPSLIREHYAEALDGFLERNGIARSALSGYVFHPGGEKVVGAFEQVLGLAAGSMRHAREVLRHYGNMSAASVLFVLERVLADRPKGRLLISSVGPGFTAAFAVMDMP